MERNSLIFQLGTTNPDGELFAYEKRPFLYVNLYWIPSLTECTFIKAVDPPHSSAECIWQRPKNNLNEKH